MFDESWGKRWKIPDVLEILIWRLSSLTNFANILIVSAHIPPRPGRAAGAEPRRAGRRAARGARAGAPRAAARAAPRAAGGGGGETALRRGSGSITQNDELMNVWWILRHILENESRHLQLFFRTCVDISNTIRLIYLHVSFSFKFVSADVCEITEKIVNISGKVWKN